MTPKAFSFFIVVATCEMQSLHSSVGDLAAISNELSIGKEEYKRISKNTEIPMYGDCWTAALKSLNEGCSALTERSQSNLALKFTNCLLDMTGQEIVECDTDEDLRLCLARMKDRPFTVYQNFFTSTRSMCHFLRIQVWHQETELTIGRLAENSDIVADKLMESKEIQDSIVESQKRTLEEMKQQTEMSKKSMKEMFDNLQDRTEEHGALIFEIFDRIGKLQNYVLEEVESFYSIFFYLTALVIGYFVTSVPRTGGARLLLFSLMFLSLAVESLIRKAILGTEMSTIKNVDELQELVRYWTGYTRYSVITISVIILIACAWKFKDYNKLNHRILTDIQKQNEEIRLYLQSLKRNSLDPDAVDGHSLIYNDSDLEDLTYQESLAETAYSSDSDMTYIPEIDLTEIIDCSFSSLVVRSNDNTEISLNGQEMVPYSRNEASRNGVEKGDELRYNLRPRKGNSNLCQSLRETPKEFFATVKLQEKLTRRRNQKLFGNVYECD
ncbi:uncharacterized protein LOC136034734 [Artemia franciscana]|uniref:uncharacterized protein LOC136034734 n=1 Tax=Artemia franciscana TaxID=6661 RepID=UPI0032DB4A8B